MTSLPGSPQPESETKTDARRSHPSNSFQPELTCFRTSNAKPNCKLKKNSFLLVAQLCREVYHCTISFAIVQLPETRNSVPHCRRGGLVSARGSRKPETRYRGTSLIRNRLPLGSCSRTVPRLLWRSKGREHHLMIEVPVYPQHETET